MMRSVASVLLLSCSVAAALQGSENSLRKPTPGTLVGELMAPEQLEHLSSSVPLHMRNGVGTEPAHTGGHFDCKVREYAYEYAQKLQGWRGSEKMKEVFDSLELETLCKQTFNASDFAATPVAHAHALLDDDQTPKAFVDTAAGAVRALLGSPSAPFATVHEAVAALRAVPRAPGQRALVILRGGTHYMTSTLELGPADSHLSIVNYPGEAASMSGAMPITTNWKPHRVDADSGAADIYVADLSSQKVKSVPGLRIDGARGVRASFPNRNPELSIFPDGWVTDTTMWTPPKPPARNESFVTLASPMLHDKTMFQNYMVGVGGHCEHYTPPVSYWCSEHPSGGGAFSFRVPSGLTYSKLKDWKDPTKGGIVNAWRPAHWANWMFEIDQWDPKTKTIGWSKGGFQGARGNNKGGEWYVENIFEELDNPNEYYYDEETSQLYYAPNSTAAGPPTGKFEAVVNQTIVKLVGTQEHPVEDVRFEGVTFRDSAYTYMEPHGVPSGGDWGLQRMGAIHLEGTKGVTIESCTVTRVDGNAIMLSGYNRNTTIAKNEFVWIGDSVIASWGYTAPLGGAHGDEILAQYKSGVDGTNGEQPRGTIASENFIHELGHFEKQSSPWFQAKSCQNVIKRNIFFNMPRAGINFNDGFGGGSEVTENLGYNTCRESSDHAVFNSWDRQPFLTDVGQKAPEPDLNPAYNTIARNFFIGNYGASMAIDNDDGSSYYKITENFEVYGGHKSNFGGHNKLRSGAVIPYSKVYQEGLCCRVNAQNEGDFTDGYWNNTCIQSAPNLTAYSFAFCDPAKPNNITNLGILHDNRVYNPDGKMMVQCGKTNGKLLTEAEFQASGADPGTTVHVTPGDDVIIGWAKAILEPLRS